MSIRDEIRDKLFRALNRLIANRIVDGCFDDEQDIQSQRHYFSTLEGLEALLVPLVHLPKNQFWEPLTTAHPELRNIVVDDINFVLNFNKDQDVPPPQHGEPYFRTGGSSQTPYWTAECSSFTLSVLGNYLELKTKYNLPTRPTKGTITEVMRTQLDWLSACKRNSSGWSWSNEAAAHPWPTWSVLDTFEELLRTKPKAGDWRRIEGDVDGVVDHLMSDLTGTTKESAARRWNESVLERSRNGQPYDVCVALDVARLILAVSHYRSGRDVAPLGRMLFEWVLLTDFSGVEYSFHLSHQSAYIWDSSLVPTVLRTLILLSTDMRPRDLGRLSDEIGGDYTHAIAKTYRQLGSSAITSGRFKDLWGPPSSEQVRYELYYSERTIEALVEMYLYLRSRDTSPFDSLAASRPAAKVSKVSPLSERTKGEKVRSALPNDIDRYTSWIPELAKREVPSALQEHDDWPIEDMFEFYLFRLFNLSMMMDGKEWGDKERGKELPDGFITIPGENIQFLYDAKSSGSEFNLSRSELRKFADYAKEAKRRSAASSAESRYFLVIAPGFRGDLAAKAKEFFSDTGLSLVCAVAADLCNFVDEIREVTTNYTSIHLVPWSELLSQGQPLLAPEDFSTALKAWKEELNRVP